MSAKGYPDPGDRIGTFLIERQIGSGGMGVVYAALQENLGRRVALKVIAPHLAGDPEFRTRFIREAHAQGNLSSPYVVHVYNHGEEDGYLYLATQLIPDGDLSSVLKKNGPLSVHSAIEVIRQVASGLQDAHEAGMVHRDIKPANILLRRTPSGLRAYITDFGVARVAGMEQTRAGFVVGTPAYQAPELHLGRQASVASDVYSLGCLLWAALAGKAPFRGSSEFQVVRGHLEDPIPQIPGSGTAIEEVNYILRRSLAKDPAERYPTAAAMRDDIDRIASMAPRVPFSALANPPRRARTLTPPSGGASHPSGQHAAPGADTGGPSGPSGPSGPGRASGASGPSRPSGPTAPLTTTYRSQSDSRAAVGKPVAWGLGIGASVVAIALVLFFALRPGGGGNDPTDPTTESLSAEDVQAASAIEQSWIDIDTESTFGPDYAPCMGTTLVADPGRQPLVDDGYLSTDLKTANNPEEVDYLSEQSATAWATAQTDCRDWDAARTAMKADPEYDDLTDEDIDDMIDCMSGIDPTLEHDALKARAMGETNSAASEYSFKVLVDCGVKVGVLSAFS